MINRTEIAAVAAQFGTPGSQIIRDHLISHVLAGIADWPDHDRVTFFGGTALCRTWLPNLRLSEDIDLLVDTQLDAEHLREHTSRRLRSEFPSHDWMRLGSQHQVETWMLNTGASEVKVQFAEWRQGWKSIPLVTRDVQLRYSDLPESVALTVPTPSGFAAMKLMAWFDRHAPRDLYDLAALADAGHIDRGAVDRVKAIAGFAPSAATLERHVPRIVESVWSAELGHQVSDTSTAERCLARIRLALDRLAPDD